MCAISGKRGNIEMEDEELIIIPNEVEKIDLTGDFNTVPKYTRINNRANARRSYRLDRCAPGGVKLLFPEVSEYSMDDYYQKPANALTKYSILRPNVRTNYIEEKENVSPLLNGSKPKDADMMPIPTQVLGTWAAVNSSSITVAAKEKEPVKVIGKEGKELEQYEKSHWKISRNMTESGKRIYTLFPAFWAIRERATLALFKTFSYAELEDLMDVFIQAAQPIIKDCRNKPNQSHKFKRILLQYILFFKYYFDSVPDSYIGYMFYHHKMAIIVGMLYDAELRSSFKVGLYKDNKIPPHTCSKIASRLCAVSKYILGNPSNSLEAVFNSEQFIGINKYVFTDICTRVLTKLLYDGVNMFTEYTYVKNIIAFHLLKKFVKDATKRKQITEKAHELYKVDIGYIQNLKIFRDVLPTINFDQIPVDKGVTKSLLLCRLDVEAAILQFRKILAYVRDIEFFSRRKVNILSTVSREDEISEPDLELDLTASLFVGPVNPFSDSKSNPPYPLLSSLDKLLIDKLFPKDVEHIKFPHFLLPPPSPISAALKLKPKYEFKKRLKKQPAPHQKLSFPFVRIVPGLMPEHNTFKSKIKIILEMNPTIANAANSIEAKLNDVIHLGSARSVAKYSSDYEQLEQRVKLTLDENPSEEKFELRDLYIERASNTDGNMKQFRPGELCGVIQDRLKSLGYPSFGLKDVMMFSEVIKCLKQLTAMRSGYGSTVQLETNEVESQPPGTTPSQVHNTKASVVISRTQANATGPGNIIGNAHATGGQKLTCSALRNSSSQIASCNPYGFRATNILKWRGDGTTDDADTVLDIRAKADLSSLLHPPHQPIVEHTSLVVSGIITGSREADTKNARGFVNSNTSGGENENNNSGVSKMNATKDTSKATHNIDESSNTSNTDKAGFHSNGAAPADSSNDFSSTGTGTTSSTPGASENVSNSIEEANAEGGREGDLSWDELQAIYRLFEEKFERTLNEREFTMMNKIKKKLESKTTLKRPSASSSGSSSISTTATRTTTCGESNVRSLSAMSSAVPNMSQLNSPSSSHRPTYRVVATTQTPSHDSTASATSILPQFLTSSVTRMSTPVTNNLSESASSVERVSTVLPLPMTPHLASSSMPRVSARADHVLPEAALNARDASMSTSPTTYQLPPSTSSTHLFRRPEISAAPSSHKSQRSRSRIPSELLLPSESSTIPVPIRSIKKDPESLSLSQQRSTVFPNMEYYAQNRSRPPRPMPVLRLPRFGKHPAYSNSNFRFVDTITGEYQYSVPRSRRNRGVSRSRPQFHHSTPSAPRQYPHRQPKIEIVDLDDEVSDNDQMESASVALDREYDDGMSVVSTCARRSRVSSETSEEDVAGSRNISDIDENASEFSVLPHRPRRVSGTNDNIYLHEGRYRQLDNAASKREHRIRKNEKTREEFRRVSGQWLPVSSIQEEDNMEATVGQGRIQMSGNRRSPSTQCGRLRVRREMGVFPNALSSERSKGNVRNDASGMRHDIGRLNSQNVSDSKSPKLLDVIDLLDDEDSDREDKESIRRLVDNCRRKNSLLKNIRDIRQREKIQKLLQEYQSLLARYEAQLEEMNIDNGRRVTLSDSENKMLQKEKQLRESIGELPEILDCDSLGRTPSTSGSISTTISNPSRVLVDVAIDTSDMNTVSAESVQRCQRRNRIQTTEGTVTEEQDLGNGSSGMSASVQTVNRGEFSETPNAKHAVDESRALAVHINLIESESEHTSTPSEEPVDVGESVHSLLSKGENEIINIQAHVRTCRIDRDRYVQQQRYADMSSKHTVMPVPVANNIRDRCRCPMCVDNDELLKHNETQLIRYSLEHSSRPRFRDLSNYYNSDQFNAELYLMTDVNFGMDLEPDVTEDTRSFLSPSACVPVGNGVRLTPLSRNSDATTASTSSMYEHESRSFTATYSLQSPDMPVGSSEATQSSSVYYSQSATEDTSKQQTRDQSPVPSTSRLPTSVTRSRQFRLPQASASICPTSIYELDEPQVQAHPSSSYSSVGLLRPSPEIQNGEGSGWAYSPETNSGSAKLPPKKRHLPDTQDEEEETQVTQEVNEEHAEQLSSMGQDDDISEMVSKDSNRQLLRFRVTDDGRICTRVEREDFSADDISSVLLHSIIEDSDQGLHQTDANVLWQQFTSAEEGAHEGQIENSEEINTSSSSGGNIVKVNKRRKVDTKSRAKRKY